MFKSELNVWVTFTVTEINSAAVPQLAGTLMVEVTPVILLSVIETGVVLVYSILSLHNSAPVAEPLRLADVPLQMLISLPAFTKVGPGVMVTIWDAEAVQNPLASVTTTL